MTIKTVKIPLSDIDALQQDGYLFRYRIKSKDGSRKSEWSPLVSLKFPIVDIISNDNSVQSGRLSFYERALGDGRPILTDAANLDPHPSNPYSTSVVATFLSNYNNSNIESSGDGTGLYTVKWNEVPSTVRQSFDIYLSWRTSATATPASSWTDWEYAGTSNTNSFSFKKPDITYQYVQAAIYLSSYPKLTNIYKQEENFVSITPTFTVYNATASSTLSAWTSTGTGASIVWTATITVPETLPSTTSFGKQFLNAKVFGEKNGVDLSSSGVTIRQRTGNNTLVLESKTTAAPAITGTGILNFRLA